MADKHPYTSGTGPLFQIVEQLRKSFPSEVTSDTLKKLGIAPNNESRVIYALRFINIVDDDGKRTEEGARVFSIHGDDAFSKAFEKLVKDAYSGLFELHGDDAWTLDRDALISYFRINDQSSATIGGRQAKTFQALSSIAGHAEAPKTRSTSESKPRRRKKKKTEQSKQSQTQPAGAGTEAKPSVQTPKRSAAQTREVGLTVRIEVNLPANGDQKTYDRIFRSIRENLIDGKGS